MKKLLITLFALTTTVFAAEGWLTDYETALAKAKEAKNPVLVVFSGSDWCPPCKKLDKEILASTEFREAMKGGKFVPLFLDFPRQKEIPAEQKKKNEALSKKFNITGFPTVLLLDADGKTLARQSGLRWQSTKEFLEWIEKSVKKD